MRGNRVDLPYGRGGLDLYRRDWMTSPSYIPSLSGIGDTSDPNAQADESSILNFQSYWNTMKGWVSSFESEIGYKISLKIQQLGEMKQKLMSMQGMDSLLNALDGDINTVNLDLQNYWQCKGYIDSFKSAWQSAASTLGLSGVRGVRGLGVLPVVAISVAAIAAAAFVASVGLALYQKYKSQTYVLDQIQSASDPEKAQILGEVAKGTTNGGVLDSAASTLTTAFQLAVFGALAYFGYKMVKSS